ncbi:multidrug effflux MFS transporter [Brachybacterium kimchii]|uniref:Multidrug effflux MFS transporter n=1 Tax=Brachybacterium kimchii TaxID=2942909 RepID=A0ABY4NBR2_9MICO|nr:multidrug effflux MFS transporter [Brachybacterium kimchii]UQN30908.1 multidrug effflux MFS transporter [Brachybacterium kimchii]
MRAAVEHRSAGPRPAAGTRRPLVVAVVLGLLAVFGPFSMNLYLPVLPGLTHDLETTTALAQLTITGCLIGLAAGQLVAGPLSDRYGRRLPLLVGVVAYVVTSLLCAAAPSIEVLLVGRLLQGVAASTGVVIALAAGRDVYSGDRLVAYYGRFTVLSGLAGAISPVFGGLLALFTDWRGTFLALTILGAVVLLAVVLGLPETLRPERRRLGGGRDVSVLGLLADRRFLGIVLVMGLVNGGLFAYLSGSTFILQSTYGVGPQAYSVLIGIISGVYMLFGWLAGRVGTIWSTGRSLLLSVVVGLAGSAGVLATALLHLPLAAMMAALLVMVSGIAAATTAATSLGMAANPDAAGSASSLLGLARYAFGAAAAPVVGLFGDARIGTTLGVLSIAVMTASLAALSLVRTRDAPPAREAR